MPHRQIAFWSALIIAACFADTACAQQSDATSTMEKLFASSLYGEFCDANIHLYGNADTGLHVNLGPDDRAHPPFDASLLPRLKEVGPIKTLSVEYYRGIENSRYTFLRDVEEIESLYVWRHYDEADGLLALISDAPGLKSFRFRCGKLKPNDLLELKKSTGLEEFTLFAPLSREHLVALAKSCPQLERLQLMAQRAEQLAHDDYLELKRLPKLKTVSLLGTSMSDEEKKKLQKEFAGITVCFNSSCFERKPK